MKDPIKLARERRAAWLASLRVGSEVFVTRGGAWPTFDRKMSIHRETSRYWYVGCYKFRKRDGSEPGTGPHPLEIRPFDQSARDTLARRAALRTIAVLAQHAERVPLPKLREIRDALEALKPWIDTETQ